MLGLVCIAVVLILALGGLIHGFRTRAFRAGRGQTPYSITMASNPVAYWTTAVLLSVTSGVCMAFILNAIVH